MSVHRRWTAVAPTAVIVGLLVVGCVDSPAPRPAESTGSVSLSVGEVQTARRYLVRPGALPRLTVEAATLDTEDFVDQANSPTVTSKLQEEGFRGAVERQFRGRSRMITGAESRVLVFGSRQAAEAFTSFLAKHPEPFFGGPSAVSRLRLGAGPGFLIKPPLCDCPGAFPLYVGVLAHAERLLWLQLTGPRASAARLRGLLKAVLASTDGVR